MDVTSAKTQLSNKFTIFLPIEASEGHPDAIQSVRITIADGSGPGADLSWVVNAPKSRLPRTFASEPPSRPMPGNHAVKLEYFSETNAGGTDVAWNVANIWFKNDATFTDSLGPSSATPKFGVAFNVIDRYGYFQCDFGWNNLVAGTTVQSHVNIAARDRVGPNSWYLASPDRITHYEVDHANPSVTISPTGLATLTDEGTIPIRVTLGSIWLVREMVIGPQPSQASRILNRQSNALEWEANRQILWSAMGANDPASQTIAVIDPKTATITRTIPVGGVASALTVTPSGQSMWIGLEGANSVRKMSLPDETLSAPISVTFPGITSRIGQIIVDPNDEDRILVVHHDAHGNHAIIVVDHGTVISANAPRGFSSAAWLGPNKIVATQIFNQNQVFTFDASGFTPGAKNIFARANPSDYTALGGRFTAVGNSILMSVGQMYNSQTLALEHGFAFNGSVPLASTISANGSEVYTLATNKFPKNQVTLRAFGNPQNYIHASRQYTLDSNYYPYQGWGDTPIPFPSLVCTGGTSVAFNTPDSICFVDNASN